MKQIGRPSKYDPTRYPEWVRGLASRGATVPEICKAMGVSHTTLNAWRQLYPDFLAALQVGRNETVAKLHNSLLKRAEGFVMPTEEREVKTIGDKEYKRITKKEIYFPPDVGAAKILLVNLDPTFKTERTESEITGKDGAPIQITSMTDAELLTKIKLIADKKHTKTP